MAPDLMTCDSCGEKRDIDRLEECACCGGFTCPDCRRPVREYGEQDVCTICREDLGYA